MQLAWEGEALRVSGDPAPGRGRVRVVAEDVLALRRDTPLPASPGAWRADRDGVTFVPRFPFVPGCRYAVVVDGVVAGVIERPGPVGPSGVGVADIFPSGAVVPRNLLRVYVFFSGRMTEGCAGGIRFDGLPDAFLPTSEELWDPSFTRLTLFLDPARIKRGLVSHEALGYPLRTGDRVGLVVDGMRDAAGAPVGTHVRELAVGPDLRHRVDPGTWELSSPVAGTRDPLVVRFDRPLDYALLQRAITAPVPGTAEVGPAEMSWRFTPDEGWAPGNADLVVDTVLEDPAGNSLRRAFDRDLADPRDDPLDASEVRLAYHVGKARLT